ncbi:MAG: nicotinate-nucleotide adenylyltransferase [Bacteroidetes bacterium]|nr:nicotinate-nucleotide adenylyltransferase [Bacteroidota bacterium]
MKIGLFFGSFNPIHIGHMVIANYMAEFLDIDQVWLVVSPHNPLKEKKSLSDARQRLMAVKKAVGKNQKINVSDIEFFLPQPSYTINTLEALNKKYPQHKFILIIGSDNLHTFHKWKEYKKILSDYKIYVYPRLSSLKKGSRRVVEDHFNVKFISAPRIDISSSFIRKQMKKGKNVKYLLA